MKIIKAGSAQGAIPDAKGELEAIRAFAKAELAEEDVYTFAVLLCDNEVDRDFERFNEKTLEELRELFVGRTGISDHNWSSENQKARIYRTELVRDEARKNSLGMPYVYLKGYAYMLRTESNAELIAEIEGGIKKETSIGCAVARSVCSICGEDIGSPKCSHIRGRTYGGKLCYAELVGAVDAYEWSFVAVPAQRNAGVLKKYARAEGLKGFVGSPEGSRFCDEYGRLEKEAALGRKYMDGLRREVLRLGLLCDRELHASLKGVVGRMEEDELLQLKRVFEQRLEDRFPPLTQLPGPGTGPGRHHTLRRGAAEGGEGRAGRAAGGGYGESILFHGALPGAEGRESRPLPPGAGGPGR